jgi:hypothetical protein
VSSAIRRLTDGHRVTSPTPVQTTVAACLAVLAAAWPLFVFDGSQSAYACALLASGVAAGALAYTQSVWLPVLLVAEIALLGPEVSGELAPGSPIAGGVRLVDLTAAIALLALGAAEIRKPGRLAYAVSRMHLGDLRALPGEAWILGGLAIWLTGLWLAHGAPLVPATRADMRITFLAVAAWLVGRHCRRGRPSALRSGLVAIGAIAGLKVALIYFTEFWVIGNYDRLQASLGGNPDNLRVILIGGDSLLVLAPAIAVLAVRAAPRALPPPVAIAGGLIALAAVVLSGTRTNLPLTLLLGALAVTMTWAAPRPAVTPMRVACFAIVALALVLGTFATGLASRFASHDAPHVGVNFRADEVRSFYDLPASELLLGQGLGARFVSKDVNGQPSHTGWAHVFPIWVQLKGGVLALLAVGALVLLCLRRMRIALRLTNPLRADAALGSILILATLAMSLTLGRAALPEGAFLIGLGVALVYRTEAS